MTSDAAPSVVLTVSGSLRAKSSNTDLLELAQLLAPEGMRVSRFTRVDELPHFNPDLDLEDTEPYPAVAAWRAALGEADGVIISCPEYAHGVPGSFKNALDWLVSSASLLDKAILLLNASPMGAELAQAQLRETLTMLGGRVIRASLAKPFLPPGFWANPTDRESLAARQSSLGELHKARKSRS